MLNLNKLSRAEMKEILGGLVNPGCMTSECSDDAGCKNSKYGSKCQISTCVATGQPANYCVSGS